MAMQRFFEFFTRKNNSVLWHNLLNSFYLLIFSPSSLPISPIGLFPPLWIFNNAITLFIRKFNFPKKDELFTFEDSQFRFTFSESNKRYFNKFLAQKLCNY